MNIAFIGNYAADAVNGVTVSSYQLAKTLVRLGHQIFFYFGASTSIHEKDENGIIRRSFLNKSIYFLPIGIEAFLQENPDEIDIFHLHSVFYFPNTLIAHILQKLDYKYVITPHGGYHDNIFEKNWLKKRIYYLIFEKKMVQKASAIFYVAEREHLDLQKFDYKGITKVIPNPIENSLPLATSMRSATDRTFNIIYLGRYDMVHKGLDNLLHIFRFINQLDSNIALHLYGEGKDKKALIKLAKNLNLKNFSMHPPIFGADKVEIFQYAHIYIQNSRWEAFGMSIFEASMAGLPVALSKGCYMADFFEQHELGIILDEDFETAAKQILTFVYDKESITAIGKKAAKLIEQWFNPVAIAKLAVEGYEEVIRANFQKK